MILHLTLIKSPNSLSPIVSQTPEYSRNPLPYMSLYKILYSPIQTPERLSTSSPPTRLFDNHNPLLPDLILLCIPPSSLFSLCPKTMLSASPPRIGYVDPKAYLVRFFLERTPPMTEGPCQLRDPPAVDFPS